ncbi:cation transport ATPase [Clostridium beijerinckii]|nr:cation transport ATPase [Clostridium beijerinckii]
MTEIIVIFALTLITLSIIFLDITKRLNLLHKILMYIYFIFAPHIVALGYFLIQHTKFGQDNDICKWIILTEIIIFILYIFIKVNIIPNNKKQIVNLRLRIALGGRSLVLYGLYTAFFPNYYIFNRKYDNAKISNSRTHISN